MVLLVSVPTKQLQTVLLLYLSGNAWHAMPCHDENEGRKSTDKKNKAEKEEFLNEVFIFIYGYVLGYV